MPTLTLSGVAEELIPRNRLRKSIVVQNEDAALLVYLKWERNTTSVSNTDHDHRLSPGSSIALNFGNDGVEKIQDRLTVIPSAGNPIVSFFETEDVVR
jgi:hypothetical protein